MDRDEALRLLRGGPEGIAEWNRKRLSGEEIPDLSDIDLRSARLDGASLDRACLIDARLEGARLVGASLQAAILDGASLDDALLDGVRLYSASLIRVSFVRARLVRARLDGTLLVGANLVGAGLQAAILDDVSLDDAILDRAGLVDASLQRARLVGARLVGARLDGARLVGANLDRAILDGAHLDGADLTSANCQRTTFGDLDLSTAQGLEAVEHRAPSILGIDTIIRSGGNIPETFLRGCGVPDAWIANIPALIGAMKPIQFYSCFISYSTADEDFARRLHSRMRDERLNVWFAPEDMKGGDKVRDQIDRAIHLQDRLLLVLSDTSMRSAWVEHELRTALRREQVEGRKVLFPIRVAPFEEVKAWECFDTDTGRDMARQVREYHIPDFSGWKDHDSFEAGFARLLRDLKAEAERADAGQGG
jgi:uncharacterized protein YjbI with pentapeptide repeats